MHDEGLVIHTMGYPISLMSYGGGFIYHMKNKRIALGYVCGLDYKNPYFNMYDNFQIFKKHPYIQNLIKDGECLEYGARTLNEGNLTFNYFNNEISDYILNRRFSKYTQINISWRCFDWVFCRISKCCQNKRYAQCH